MFSQQGVSGEKQLVCRHTIFYHVVLKVCKRVVRVVASCDDIAYDEDHAEA